MLSKQEENNRFTTLRGGAAATPTIVALISLLPHVVHVEGAKGTPFLSLQRAAIYYSFALT